MARRYRLAAVIAIGTVLGLVGTALATVSYGAQVAIPGPYAWNYSNSLDYTGAGSTFKLQEAFVSDNALPQEVMYTSSANGTNWSAAKKISGAQHAEGSSLAAAGSNLIVGWMTWVSYNNYQPSDPRRVQVTTSANGGNTWTAVTDLTNSSGRVDYPIVAAAKTSTGAINYYVVWADANTGSIKFRMKSGAAAWTAPITLGSTTANANDGEGFYGFANIAAVRDLILVGWISDNTGTVKERAVNLGGNNTKAAAIAGWTATKTLTTKISLAQTGYPIASASPADTGRVTLAWNTTTAQRYTTWNGTTLDNVGKVIYTNAAPYTGGYAVAAEPAGGGGIVASWSACRNTTLAQDCDYGSGKARIDLVAATSANGTSFGAPVVVSSSSVNKQPITDEPSIVYANGKTYIQYNAYTYNYTSYDVFIKTGTGSL